jgi:hypothetical protein
VCSIGSVLVSRGDLAEDATSPSEETDAALKRFDMLVVGYAVYCDYSSACMR